jgi:exosortase H (IPTLxxWG-CTERM-specific)
MPVIEKASAFLSANRRALLFLLRFALIFGLAYFVFGIAPGIRNGVIRPYTEWLARAVAWTVNLFGAGAIAQGQTVRSSQFSMQIAMGCDGVEASCLFLAGVMAYPTTWRARMIGLAAGVPAVHLINLARLVMLYYAGILLPSVVEEVHVYVAQTIVILFSTILLLFWLQRVAAPYSRA